ncbi:hypothetical protein HNP46_000361 [Pseudomonas nitritireducens]|uniref:Uncharacterized protein n=1 Tax=Pseudomonas nitroreducens TaxID=46680 RepID=A0A7W7KET6_PSENT|nr:hypothetical protein [Pseudomonas nitritireducens]MBB4861550.1 hypothetical protein [Pseudomonas nitritireducens]
MQITFSPYQLDPNARHKVFKDRMESKMEVLLRDECILDSDGINRVLPQLYSIWMNGHRGFSSSMQFPNNGVPEAIEELKASNTVIIDAASGIVMHVLETMLSAAARELAALDERLHRRPRH